MLTNFVHALSPYSLPGLHSTDYRIDVSRPNMDMVFATICDTLGVDPISVDKNSRRLMNFNVRKWCYLMFTSCGYTTVEAGEFFNVNHSSVISSNNRLIGLISIYKYEKSILNELVIRLNIRYHIVKSETSKPTSFIKNYLYSKNMHLCS
jgi:hypothetical protein